MRRAAWAAAAVAAALVLVLLVSRRGSHDGDGERAPAPAAPPAAADRGPPPALGPAPVAAPVDDAAIATVLGEELVAVASGVRIAALTADEPQPCAGRPVELRASLEGTAGEARLVSRWLWSTGSGLTMQPGQSLRFTAPAPGTFPIRFQVVRSLEGRRVGVLAEQTLELPVVDCGAGPAPLRLDARVVGGRADFTALATVATSGPFTWDFGDGQRGTTDGASARHDYPIVELGAEQVRSYRAVVEVRAADGATLRATTAVTLRGQASPPLPPAIAAELGEAVWDDDADRWQRRLEVDNRERPPITWERGERHTSHDDGRVTSRQLAVAELLAIVDRRDDGGFVATITVTAAETGPGVRRITDHLLGRDAAGEEASLTWVAWDRDDHDPAPVPPAPPRR